MNIENFQLFCQVVEEGSFSEVARKNFLSQPAITRKMNQIEEKYGGLLFNRGTGKLSLTKAGEILYPYAKEIVEYDIKSVEAVRLFLGLQEQSINIGASLTIGEYLLPGILGEFNKTYKDMKFSLTIGNTPFILSELDHHKIDIALVESEVTDKGFLIEKFANDELILVTSAEHRWKNKREISLTELLEEKMIWREKESGMRIMIERALEEKGILESIINTMELGSLQSIKSAVEANLGVSLLPRITVEKELNYGTLWEVNVTDFSLKRDLCIVEKPQRFVKDGILRFKEFVREESLNE